MLDLIKFGRYKILEKIGSGGIATVYKAMSYDEKLVALKILSSQDPEDIRRFKREFLLLNSIKHSNIIQVYDFGYTSKTEPYFSMELIRGADLKTYFRELSLQRFYIALIQICQTLEFIHYKNIIHGDLKPSNVLISSDQKGKLKVKFTDFGFAQFGKSIDSAQWKGSLPYLAPEIIRGEEYNHQVDLYSLGVMMYEVITGELPFKDKDLMDLAKAHLDQEPEFPEDIEIPKVLNEIIQKLLHKDPLDRYYSAQEVINDLRKVTEISTKENEILLCKSLVSSHPFIGRDNERSLLKETYQKAQIGESAIVLIKGEFGIGKTKLLKEFKNFIQLNKGVLICGRASDITKIHLANLQNFSKKHLPMVVLLDDFNNLSLKITRQNDTTIASKNAKVFNIDGEGKYNIQLILIANDGRLYQILTGSIPSANLNTLPTILSTIRFI